ncbi:ABC transporter substrate-binding protein [Paenibacillus sp. HB172176]|uniref:ABC transporter substrate-binding protein n=1 Tax=Paenibacillus sp. HB172176 TaxID=2493690 RepID=UPI001F0E4FAD|nr:ABC transporter substrate-binding protein [Paenibacillus sp. HB172176]
MEEMGNCRLASFKERRRLKEAYMKRRCRSSKRGGGPLFITILSLIILISLGLLAAGCSWLRSNESASTMPEERESMDPGLDTANQVYTLKLVYTGLKQKDEALVEAAINNYLTGKLEARLDLMPIDWGQWDDRVNLLIASREKIDILFTAQWNKHGVNVAKGAFVELSGLLKQYGQGILDSLNPIFLEGSQIDGGNYGVPTNKELASQGGIIYRSDVAAELGIDMTQVHSIEDLDLVFAKVKQERPDMLPIYMKQGETFNAHYIGNYDALGDTSIPGIILKDGDDTKVLATYENERYVETLRITREFFQKGYINGDAVTNQMMNIDALKAGEVFAITASLKPGKAEEIAVQTGLIGKLDQKELNVKTIATSETAGAMLGISSTSRHPELAMQFINLLHTDKTLNNLLNYGIEGLHYEKVDKEVIRQTERTADYFPGANWMFGNQFLNYLWESEERDKWEKFRQFNENAHVSPGLGFIFDSNSVKSEVAAVVNVDRQYLTALDTGSVDIEHVLPEYIQKLKEAGIERIVAEKQRQFNGFLRMKNRAK